MQTITTRSLLHIAPMSKQWRDKMLAIVDELDDDNRYEVEKACWSGIAKLFRLRMDEESYKITKEINEGKREYDRADYTAIPERLYQELVAQLDSASSEVALEEIRQKLQEQLKPQGDAS